MRGMRMSIRTTSGSKRRIFSSVSSPFFPRRILQIQGPASPEGSGFPPGRPFRHLLWRVSYPVSPPVFTGLFLAGIARWHMFLILFTADGNPVGFAVIKLYAFVYIGKTDALSRIFRMVEDVILHGLKFCFLTFRSRYQKTLMRRVSFFHTDMEDDPAVLFDILKTVEDGIFHDRLLVEGASTARHRYRGRPELSASNWRGRGNADAVWQDRFRYSPVAF